MANKQLFASLKTSLPRTDTVNRAGGTAYALPDKHALAQLAATGCLSATFYASEEDQLGEVLALASKVEPEFVAKVALYARSAGQMKDMPALLAALLSVRDPSLLARVFDRVIDSPRQLRTFVQIVRSGAVGRKSLGTRPKRLVHGWLDARADDSLLDASIGNDPSLADVIKMVHPKPKSPARSALYGYLLGRPHDAAQLPDKVRAFEDYKRTREGPLPDLPFQLLTALDLGTTQWRDIALRASFQTLRMNLNTFLRHGVFADDAVVQQVAARLRDRPAIKRARVLPFQLLSAYRHVDERMPAAIRQALEDAAEIATENVPALTGKIVVCPDVSGSMSCPLTGFRKGASSKLRCVDVAALITATLLRTCSDVEVLPFDCTVRQVTLDAKAPIMKTAMQLAALCGGATCVSAPLSLLDQRGVTPDLVLVVSDNESWVETARGQGGRATATLEVWSKLKRRNPEAKLVCLDLTPTTNSQAPDRSDVLNVGGFSDQVFSVIHAFHAQGANAQHWVDVIEQITI